MRFSLIDEDALARDDSLGIDAIGGYVCPGKIQASIMTVKNYFT